VVSADTLGLGTRRTVAPVVRNAAGYYNLAHAAHDAFFGEFANGRAENAAHRQSTVAHHTSSTSRFADLVDRLFAEFELERLARGSHLKRK
jgi:hypothetical protein